MNKMYGFFLLISTLTILMVSGCSNNNDQESTTKPIAISTSSPAALESTPTQLQNNKWETVSRGYRIKGKLAKIAVVSKKINSLTINVTDNMKSNNPVDYDFKGQTLVIQFENGITDDEAIQYLKPGSVLAISFAQYAQPDGKIVYGANLNAVYIVKDNNFLDLQGKEITEENLNS